MRDSDILGLLDAIYSCGAGQKPWSHFVEAYRSQFPSLKISIAGYDSEFKDLNFFLTGGIPEPFANDFASHYYKINPWEKIVLALPAPPEVAWVHDYLPTSELTRTPFYNEFLKPLDDIATGFGSVLIREPDRFLNFQANLSFKHMDEGLRAAECMRRIGPHLVRGFELYRRLGDVSVYAGAIEDALNRLTNAVFIVDADLRLLFANETAHDLLRQGSVVRSKAPARLMFCASENERLLRQQMTLGPDKAALPAYFRLHCPADRPLVGFLSPLRLGEDTRVERGGRILFPRQLFVLFLIPPKHRIEASEAAIRAVLGVTGAEAALACSLINGLSLQQHAQAANITYHTARSHMKALVAKTNAKNQAALIQTLTKIFWR